MLICITDGCSSILLGTQMVGRKCGAGGEFYMKILVQGIKGGGKKKREKNCRKWLQILGSWVGSVGNGCPSPKSALQRTGGDAVGLAATSPAPEAMENL